MTPNLYLKGEIRISTTHSPGFPIHISTYQMTNGTKWHIIEYEYLNGEIRLPATTHWYQIIYQRLLNKWIQIDWLIHKKQWPIDRRG